MNPVCSPGSTPCPSRTHTSDLDDKCLFVWNGILCNLFLVFILLNISLVFVKNVGKICLFLLKKLF